MTVFQIILLVAFGGALGLTLLAAINGWTSRRMAIAWAPAWLVGIVATITPDTTTRIANAVGIRRGTDLVVYCATLAMMIGFFMIYLRLRRVRRELTIVVRRMAILDAREGEPAQVRTEESGPDTSKMVDSTP